LEIQKEEPETIKITKLKPPSKRYTFIRSIDIFERFWWRKSPYEFAYTNKVNQYLFGTIRYYPIAVGNHPLLVTEDDRIPKRKRGAQLGRKPRSRNIPESLSKKEVTLDFEKTPYCQTCETPYERISAFDKVSNHIAATVSAVHEIVTRHSYKKVCNCQDSPKIVTAPQRKSVIKKSILTTGTWVHLRRDFINLKSQKIFKNDPAIGKWVDDWLNAIKMIFKLNKQRLKCSSKKEFAELTEKMRSIIENLCVQNVDDLEYNFQKKILKSFKKRYSGYTIFIDNPEVPLHNNRAEQLLKIAINGRKNYLGNVSCSSVFHTQIFLSIIATAKNNNIAPQKWLEDYLNACAENYSKPLQGQILKHHVNKLLNQPS